MFRLRCQACSAEYIGKTDRCLRVNLDEHGTNRNLVMFQHLEAARRLSFCYPYIIYLSPSTIKLVLSSLSLFKMRLQSIIEIEKVIMNKRNKLLVELAKWEIFFAVNSIQVCNPSLYLLFLYFILVITFEVIAKTSFLLYCACN